MNIKLIAFVDRIYSIALKHKHAQDIIVVMEFALK